MLRFETAMCESESNQKQDNPRSTPFQQTGIGVLCLLAFTIAQPVLATTFDVGTNGTFLPTLASVPWGALQPGDTVNIHYKPGGYHEIIQISQAGTATQPITIHGIPDPVTGALPTIDGSNAVMDIHVNFRDPFFENLGVVLVTARASNFVWGVTAPAWITIDSLHICDALYQTNGITFTDEHGATRIFGTFACGIYIEYARNLTISNCEVGFNGNGIFANSNDGTNRASSNLLIENNYLHHNGNPLIPGLDNGWSEHNAYIESDGAVYQYNRFGPLRAGCHGCMIKDRSAGTVVRYNEFESTEASEIVAIIDPQGGAGYLEFKPYYPDAYVYGNLITLLNNSNVWSGTQIAELSALNSPDSYPTEHRGTLYFYNNTIVSHQNASAVFLINSLTGTNLVLEKIDSRNNIFYADTSVQENIYHALEMFYSPGNGGTLNLATNWISPGTLQIYPEHPFGGTINGWNELIVGDTNGLDNPGFADIADFDYHLLAGANAMDAAGPLATNVLPTYAVSNQYVSPQSSIPRVTLGAGPDLGALESVGTLGPGRLQFGITNYLVDETAAFVTLSVTRSGGFNGAVSVNFATTDGTAIAATNYVPTNGVLSWTDGEAAPKLIQIPIQDDEIFSGNQAFSVRLASPGGGAALGTTTTATVTILEADLAPPTPPNTPPVADWQTLSVTSTVPIAIRLTGHDADNDPLTFNLLTQPTRGSLSGTPPNVTYVSVTNSFGSDGFAFNVSDGKTNSATAMVEFGINSNPPPIAAVVSPTNHAVIIGPTNVTIVANVSSPSEISFVNFVAGTNFLGTVAAAPYVFTWTNAPTGTYPLIAWAISYSANTRAFSTPVTVSILGARPVLNFQPKGSTQAMIRWPLGVDGWQLQEAPEPSGPWSLSWQPVYNLTTQHAAIIPVDADRRFFRIVMPQ